MGLLPEGFCFSQASLATGEGCLRRFYLRYLRRLNWPRAADRAGLEKEEGAARGRLFHHLVLQHQLGLAAADQVRAGEDPVLAGWWEHFISAPPRGVPAGRVHGELELWAPLGRWWVRARFDRLVVAEGGGLCIVDWKTGRNPPASYLETWQTLVYCFVACEGGALLWDGVGVAPEQISLCYWCAAYPGQEQWHHYDRARHREGRARIEALARRLAALERPEDFALTADLSRCAGCEFRAYCGRGTGPGPGWEEEEEEPDAVDGMEGVSGSG
jgi:RecB family exonuclease